MKPIRKLNDLVKTLIDIPSRTLAVAMGEDPDTILAVAHAVKKKVINAILVGDKKEILKVAKRKEINSSIFEIIHMPGEIEATEEAVRLVREKKADMLMKGLVKTPNYMKIILDRRNGLLPVDGLLSHVAVMEVATYPKLLIVSDAAIIPEPDLNQKVQILHYTTEIANAIGIEKPKAAMVSATETISFKVQSSVDAAVITAMTQRKQIKGVIVDGPLSLDVSLSKKHCKIKGLDSPINGEADILVFPNIETANTFYKCTTLLAKGISASVVVGTTVPVILTSRTDDDDSKFYSIILAAKLATERSLNSLA